MSRCAFNDTTFGQYDFCLQLVQLNSDVYKRTSEQFSNIFSSSINNLTDIDFKIYQTYLHEMTHFLDSTTTLWGAEYSGRLYKYLLSDKDQTVDVFSISDSEIQLHFSSKSDEESRYINFSKLKHSLAYDEDNGVHTIINYIGESGDIKFFVPLSMLAIMEGHAYCQEKLIEFKQLKNTKDVVGLSLFQQEINSLLQDSKNSEYSCLLAFVVQLFPHLLIGKQLEIVVFLCRFSLNTPLDFLLINTSTLKHIFCLAPDELISAMEMEFSRGGNRAQYAFVLLVVLALEDEKLNIINDGSKIEDFEKIVIDALYPATKNFPDQIKAFYSSRRREIETYYKILKGYGADLPALMISQSIDSSLYEIDLISIMLPEIMLYDGTFVGQKNCLNYSIEKHEAKFSLRSSKLERQLKEHGVKKEHLTPHIAHDWLQRIKAGETGIQFYPD